MSVLQWEWVPTSLTCAYVSSHCGSPPPWLPLDNVSLSSTLLLQALLEDGSLWSFGKVS